jgi:hypothetical protein
MATMLYWTGDLDQAMVRLNELIDIDPSNPATAVAREILSDVYESKGRLKQAIVQRVQTLRMNGEHHEADELDRDYAAVGFQAAMQNFYERQLNVAAYTKAGWRVCLAVYLAILFIHLEQVRTRHFNGLDPSVAESAPWLSMLRIDPAFKALRSDPRFQNVVDAYEHPASPPFQ